MHSFVTSKNAQWPRLIWPTLYIFDPLPAVFWTSLGSLSHFTQRVKPPNFSDYIQQVNARKPLAIAHCSMSLRTGSGRPLIALSCLLLLPVSTPLRILNGYCSGIPVSGGV